MEDLKKSDKPKIKDSSLKEGITQYTNKYAEGVGLRLALET